MAVCSQIPGKKPRFPGRKTQTFSIHRKKTADLRTSYTHDRAHIETNISSDASGPVLNGSVVLGQQGWLLGYQYVYSTAKAALTKNNFAVGFKGKDFTVFGNM